MKKLILFILLVAFVKVACANVVGYWTTVDDETNEAKSVVRVYEYQGKLYARVVALLKNKEAKAKLPNSPKIEGLDIVWDLQPKGKKYKGGEILDPKSGKVYACEMWREGDKLIVRGKIAFLGRNQTWLPNHEFNSEEVFIPKKPRLK